MILSEGEASQVTHTEQAFFDNITIGEMELTSDS
jgi:hypothetical protein